MVNGPFFSIVIPCLNEEKYLPLLLKDIVNQTFRDFEVIVVDGHSDDSTVAKVKRIKNLPLLKVINATKRNVSFQRNLGAAEATGKWVAFMDADNRLEPFFLQGLRYQIDKHPRTQVYTCLLESKKYALRNRPLIEAINVTFELAVKVRPYAPGAMIIVKDTWAKKSAFSEKMKIMEDIEYVEKIVKKGAKFKLLKEPRFFTSLRRYQTDKTLPLLKTYLLSHFYYLTNQTQNRTMPDYPMKGGQYYQTKETALFKNMFTDLQTLSRQRLSEVKKMLRAELLP